MKTSILYLLTFVAVNVALSQKIIITPINFSDTADYIDIWKYENPILFFPQDRKTLVYKNGQYITDYAVKQPHWIEIFSTPVLLLPGENIVGTLSETKGNWSFLSSDSTNINFEIQKILSGADAIRGGYSEVAETVIPRSEKLKLFFDSSFKLLRSPAFTLKFKLNDLALLAIHELLSSYCAWYYSLLFDAKQSSAKPEKINKLVQNKINIYLGKYWLQNQKGILFLKKYFFSVSLPQYNYNVARAMAEDKFFKDKNIQKYLYYEYFNELSEHNELPNNLEQSDSLFNRYLKEYSFSTIELKELETLKSKKKISSKNITDLFAAQKLINVENHALSREVKIRLIQDNKNLIVYYWASWCPPCVAFLQKLKKDTVMYNGIKCRMLFISVDAKRTDWLKRKYAVLNNQNSFNLQDITSPSIFNTYIKGIALPHLFLIQNGVMQNQNVDKSKISFIK